MYIRKSELRTLNSSQTGSLSGNAWEDQGGNLFQGKFLRDSTPTLKIKTEDSWQKIRRKAALLSSL